MLEMKEKIVPDLNDTTRARTSLNIEKGLRRRVKRFYAEADDENRISDFVNIAMRFYLEHPEVVESADPKEIVKAVSGELTMEDQDLAQRFLQWWRTPAAENSGDQAFKAGVAKLLSVSLPPSKGTTKK